MGTGRSVGIALAPLTIAAALIPALAGAAAERSVTIVDDAYDPRTITVTAGDSVSWRWADGNANPHTVTAFDGSFDSDAACPPENPSACRAAGHSFSVEFTEPGTYAYRCRVHPVTMIGTVDVVAASEEPSEEPSEAEPTPAAPSEAASERDPSEGEPSSPPPSGEERASSRTTRGSAGPPGFVVESLPSSAPSGEGDDPVAAPPPSVETSPGQPVAAAPTAAPSGSPAAIGRVANPPRRAAVGAAAALVILSTVALGRFVLFARRW